jgi:hypothetical protein
MQAAGGTGWEPIEQQRILAFTVQRMGNQQGGFLIMLAMLHRCWLSHTLL